MNLGYTLQQKNHKALLMMDYYKQKIEIYMTQDAYNLFRVTCDDRIFKKIALSNVKFSEIKSEDEKNDISRRDFKFMLEVPKNYSDVVWRFINANPDICAGVFKDEAEEEEVVVTNNTPTQQIVDTAEPQTTVPNMTAKVVPDKQKVVNTRPKTLLDLKKRPYPDGLTTEIYMTQDALRRFRAVCNSRLLSIAAFGTIKHIATKRHIVKHGYDSVLEIPNCGIATAWQIINSNPDIRDGIYNPEIQKHITDKSIKPVTQSAPQQQSTQLKTTKQKRSESFLQQDVYKFQDLTPKLAEKIFGVKKQDADIMYFYNTNKTHFNYCGEIKDIIESHPLFTGRQLAAIAVVATVPYENGQLFVKNPVVLNREFREPLSDLEYDIRGTFISYDTITKQFEKHPAGWLKLSAQNKPLNAFLSIIKSKTDYIMTDFADKQRTK